jgi:hypothetical protein
MNEEKVLDWAALPGEEVQIRKHGETVMQGRVDAVMADASILWLQGLFQRTLFEKSQGYTVWRCVGKAGK